MQITPNSDTTDTQETPQDEVAVETNPYPLEEGQDQLVFVLDLRRQDPINPLGSPAADLGFFLSGPGEVEKAQALSFLVDSIAELFDFDSSLSRVGIAKIVDFEPGSGSATLDEFRSMVAGLVPTPEVEEIQTEQPIEMTGGGDIVDAEDPAPETTDAPALPDEVLDAEPDGSEGNPVGDSVASDPGPVDPPVEG